MTTPRSDTLPGFEPAPEPEQLERRTPGERAAESIAAGVHPATRRPIRPGDDTCGGCAHLWHKQAGNGAWWKCREASTPRHDGPDMTKRWPACTAFVPAEDGNP